RLAQCLDNLLDNAARFAPAGRATVAVRADEAAGRAVLTVSDTGAGIAPELLARVVPGVGQGGQGGARSGGGLGLGLSVVRGVVELHGGTAEAFSEGPGRGATFTLRLPLEREPGALVEASEAPAPGAAGRHRVLVVEDNADAAAGLRM